LFQRILSGDAVRVATLKRQRSGVATTSPSQTELSDENFSPETCSMKNLLSPDAGKSYESSMDYVTIAFESDIFLRFFRSAG